MTILELINKLENKKQILKFLGELLWQSNLTNFGLLEKFLNTPLSDEELLWDINNEWMIHQLWKFFKREYVLIAKLILKDLVDSGLKDSMDLVYIILEGKSNKQIFKDIFEKRIQQKISANVGE